MLNFPLCLGSCKINFIILWGVWKLQDKLHLTMAYLAQLGSATGVYKTLMKYLVRVPEVWLSWMFNTWLCWLLFFVFFFSLLFVVVWNLISHTVYLNQLMQFRASRETMIFNICLLFRPHHTHWIVDVVGISI
jgi:hypothetical protein